MGYKRNKKKNRQQDEGASSSQPQGDDTDLKALLETDYRVTAEEYESLLPYIPAAEALSNDDDDVTTALRALELAQMAEAVPRRREAPVPPAESHNQQLQKSQSEEPVSIDHQEGSSSCSEMKQQQQEKEQEQEQELSQPQPQPPPQGDQEPPPSPLPSVPTATTPSAPLAALIHNDNLKFFLETYYGVKPKEYDTLFPYIRAANAMPSGSVLASAAPLVAAMKALALASTEEAAARRGEPQLPPAAAATDSITYQELMGNTRINKHRLQEQEPSQPQSQGFQPWMMQMPSSSSSLDLSISSPSVLTAARQHINQQSLLSSSSVFPLVPPPPVPSACPAPVDKNVPGVRPAINMKALMETDFGVAQEQYINNLFTKIPRAGDPDILAAKAKQAAAMAETAKAALEAAIIQVLARRGTQQSMGRQKSKKQQQQLEKCNQQQLLQRQEQQQEQELDTSSCLSSSGPPIELVPFEFRSYGQQWMLLPSSSYLDLSSGSPFLPNSFSSRVFFEVRRENQNSEQSSTSTSSASSAAPRESGVHPADLVALMETYVRSGGPIYLTPKQYCALFPQIAALNEITATRAATETEMLAGAQAAEDAAYAALAEAQAARRGPPLLPGARALYAALFQEGSWPSCQLYFNPLMERTITMDRPQPCAAPAPNDDDYEDFDGHHDVDVEVGPGSLSAAGNSGGGDSGAADCRHS